MPTAADFATVVTSSPSLRTSARVPAPAPPRSLPPRGLRTPARSTSAAAVNPSTDRADVTVRGVWWCRARATRADSAVAGITNPDVAIV